MLCGIGLIHSAHAHVGGGSNGSGRLGRRRHKLHILRFCASAKALSLRCAAFSPPKPLRWVLAGTPRQALTREKRPQALPAAFWETFLIHAAHAHVGGSRNGSGRLGRRRHKLHILRFCASAKALSLRCAAFSPPKPLRWVLAGAPRQALAREKGRRRCLRPFGGLS